MTMTLANRYQVLATLGEGGMGTVYRVEDTTRSETLALKLMTAGGDMSEAAFLRFKQEFRAMGRLQHPNTCRVFDYGRLPDGTPYFTMEEVAGADLDSCLPLAPETVTAVLMQLCAALGAIHQQGYVHGDLKPENIRLTPGGQVKLMDFGLMEPSGQVSEEIKGTMAYIAPEVAKGGRVDQRADLYSLGAVAYHLLAGRPPFAADSPVGYMRAHLSEVPQPLDAGVPQIGPALAALVLQLLEKEPVDRPQSASDVMAALGGTAVDGPTAHLLVSPFTGRGEVQTRLNAALEQLLGEGRGETLWIVGEAGVGKTRLLEEFRWQAQLKELPCLSGTCGDTQAPFGPFVSILRAALPLARLNCPEALATHGPVLARFLPELAVGAGGVELDPEQERAMVPAAFTSLLTQAFGPRGGVLLLDDWHRADALSEATWQYLRRNAASGDRQAKTGPVVTVLATQGPAPAGERSSPLAGLEGEEFAQWLKGTLGAHDVPESLARQLQEASRGVPREARNHLTHLIETGVLTMRQGRWQLPAQVAASDLPSDVKAAMLGRLGTLSHAQRQVLDLLAVAARPVPLATASALLGLSDEDLVDAVDALLTRGLLEESPAGVALADPALAELQAESLDAELRGALHLGLAQRLREQLALQPGDLALLMRTATHFLKSPDRASAAHYAYEAAIALGDLALFQPAEALLVAGHEALLTLPPSRERDAAECDYGSRLGRNVLSRHALDEARSWTQRAQELAEGLGDRRRLLLALANAMQTEAVSHKSDGQTSVVALGEQVLALASELDDKRTFVRTSRNLAHWLGFNGQVERALGILETALALGDQPETQFYYARALGLRGHLRAISNQELREAGMADLAAAATLQARNGDKYGGGYTLNLLADVQIQAGRYQEAARTSQEHVELMIELGVIEDVAVAWLNLTIAQLESGLLDEALASARKVAEVAGPINLTLALLIGQAVLAVIQAQRGRVLEATHLIEKVLESSRSSTPYVGATVFPLAVQVWVLAGDLDRAASIAQEARFFLRSLEIAEARLALELVSAELALAQGRMAEAREFAEAALNSALEQGARGSLVKALRLKAAIALKEQPLDEARKLAEKAYTQSQQAAMRYQSALLAGMLGEMSLAAGHPDAGAHFQAMQALADESNAPLLRARALFGQAQARPGTERAGDMTEQAQRLVTRLCADMPEATATLFKRQPLCEVILAADVSGPAAEGTATTGMVDRLNRVSLDLVSITDQYAQMFKQWTSKSDQLEKLNMLSARINGSLKLDEVLHHVVALTLDISKAERGFLLLKEGGRYEGLIVHAALDQFGRPIPDERFSMSICSRVMASGQAVTILDASMDGEFQAAKSIMALQLQTVMCVPLQAKGKKLGVLYVDSRALVGTFDERDLTLLQAVANHAAVAIDNAMLYQDLNNRTAQLESALDKLRQADMAANTDVLTGLRNRRSFTEVAMRELDVHKRYHRPLCVIMLDVDHFKLFNDTYGHATGDEVLKAIGRVLPGQLRPTDVGARLGGEEFVVLCPASTEAEAAALAERIRGAIAEVSLADVDGRPVRKLTATLGVALLQPDDAKIADLLERADQALYVGKRSGRNQVALYRAPAAAAEHA